MEWFQSYWSRPSLMHHSGRHTMSPEISSATMPFAFLRHQCLWCALLVAGISLVLYWHHPPMTEPRRRHILAPPVSKGLDRNINGIAIYGCMVLDSHSSTMLGKTADFVIVRLTRSSCLACLLCQIIIARYHLPVRARQMVDLLPFALAIPSRISSIHSAMPQWFVYWPCVSLTKAWDFLFNPASIWIDLHLSETRYIRWKKKSARMAISTSWNDFPIRWGEAPKHLPDEAGRLA